MNISAEEKNRYLREAETVLAREGFHTERTNGKLCVLLDGAPICWTQGRFMMGPPEGLTLSEI